MRSCKPYLALGALLLVSFAVSTTADCNGCRGQELVKIADELEQKEICWFSDEHSYLMKFKLQLLNAIFEQLTILIKSTCETCKTGCECKTNVISCAMKKNSSQASCHIENTKSLAQTYAESEKCCGKASNPKQLDLVLKLMNGVMIGWRQIHTTC